MYFMLQLVFEVMDDGGLSDQHRVDVAIDRNLNSPVMSFVSLNTTILENTAIGSTLAPSVVASDADTSVSVLIVALSLTLTLFDRFNSYLM